MVTAVALLLLLNANVKKNLHEIWIKLIFQLWKHCYRRSKPEAGQSSASRWTFYFINANLHATWSISIIN